MVRPLVSKKKADALSNGAFLIGIGVLLYLNSWWPSLLLVLWVTVVIRQLFTGRLYDAFLSTIILVGLFIVSYVKVQWTVIVPILFVLGGIYIIFREYFYADETLEDEALDEISENAEDDRKHK